MPFPKKNAFVVWTLCKTYKRSNSTSNLLDHLNRKHFTVLNRDHMRVNEEREEDENTPGTSEVNTSVVILRAEIVTTGPIVTRQKQMVLSNRFNHYPTGLETF
ncbi:uncharacterized protein LOC132951485 [Metopolophium dirhodum]|uniref:uncharacterized protein LOC132951485 n=1 Tax=Metopolophium dirhodum TaxID=44670 RepID=UPI00299082A2|nr:uncharacterized protein LOC132951485 [Metopolophium dirhodum]